MLSGLLRLSRVGRQKFEIQPIRYESTLISEVLSTLEIQIKESDMQISVSDLPPCKGDYAYD